MTDHDAINRPRNVGKLNHDDCFYGMILEHCQDAHCYQGKQSIEKSL